MVFGLFLECCGFKSLDLSQLALELYKLEDGSLMGFRGTYDSPTYKSRKKKRKATVGLCCNLTIIVYSLDNDISPLNLRAKRRNILCGKACCWSNRASFWKSIVCLPSGGKPHKNMTHEINIPLGSNPGS